MSETSVLLRNQRPFGQPLGDTDLRLLTSNVIEDYSATQTTPTREVSSTEIRRISQADSSSSSWAVGGYNIFPILPRSTSWLLQFISQLSVWLLQFPTGDHNQPESPIPVESRNCELWIDWEWVLDKTEELSRKQSQEEASFIQKELSHLRTVANALQYRSFFTNAAESVYEELSEKDRNESTGVLLSSESSKIISDVIEQFSEQWLQFVQRDFFPDTEDPRWIAFSGSYREKPYERNVVGSLKELAFSACHGPKGVSLSIKVIGDIAWSLWKTLTMAIRTGVNRELTKEELLLVANEVAKAQGLFVHLWVRTVRNSKLGKAREGLLVKKWAEDYKKEQQRISKIKAKGVDARYEYQPYNRNSVTVKDATQKKELAELKKTLEHKLNAIFKDF